MIYQVIIPESLYSELEEVVEYYKSKEIHLALNFISKWESAMEQLKHTPLHYQKKNKEFRTIKINRFPYLLVFEIIGAKVYVYRLINAHKNPKTIFKK
ncbi:MAG: type II toxin-antitoxin system RelE/ParE family toxin [Bacteroidetes bacterium]|nr:type II toxin-antitoxin system RelE/ParE family toxin [Bacteroidota bacterium]